MPTVTDPAASVPREEAPLAIQILIEDRSRELELSRSEVVRRCGYKKITKGIRRLDALYAGDLKETTFLIAGLAIALKVSPDIVQRAVNQTLQQLEERASRSAAETEAAWRAASNRMASY